MPPRRCCERPAVVLGQTVAVLDDLEPGAEASVDVAVQFGQFTQSLSDKVVGQMLRKRRDHDTGRWPGRMFATTWSTN